jgi:hypothetical protein
MPEPDDLMAELRDLGDTKGATDYDLDESQRELEERFLGDDLENVGQGGPAPYRAVVPAAQPCNKATMVCLRGPCAYLWSMTTRFGADDGEHVHIQRHRVCTKHTYETQLADQNIYVCEGWKPAPLAWLPDSIWVTIARLARDLYEAYLKRLGYNIDDWRWFKLDSFEWDSSDKRGFSGPGGGHKYDKVQAEKTTRTGYGAKVPEEKSA